MASKDKDLRRQEEQNRQRMEQWLTRGTNPVVRTRGAIRTRGAVPAPVSLRPPNTVTTLLERLEREVEAAWVVVVDGTFSDFARELSRQIQSTRANCKFWLIESSETGLASNGPIRDLKPARLNVDKPEDLLFSKNLVADLAIVPSDPPSSQGARIGRWLSHSSYILVERPSALSAEDIQRLYPHEQRTLVFEVEGGRLRSLA